MVVRFGLFYYTIHAGFTLNFSLLKFPLYSCRGTTFHLLYSLNLELLYIADFITDVERDFNDGIMDTFLVELINL